MKKLLVIILVLPIVVFAAPVSKERASTIGENFFCKSIKAHRIAGKQSHFIVQQQPNMRKVRKNTGNTYAPYYIFNNEDGGFVIVAGDDCATPILGYSTEGSIDPNNLPIQLEELLNAYAEEIQQSVENNDQPTDSIQALWDAYYRAPQSQNSTATVNALIVTTWDQYPRYNNKCPSDASLSSLGGHPTTGCVATAMAQIMKYWEYPSQGSGYKSYNSERYGTLSANFAITAYDWPNMPLKLTSSTSNTQNNAVATLMYHCGVAVEMEYNRKGDGSSGALVVDNGKGRACAENALKSFFGYSSTIQGKTWVSSISAATWKSMLKNELDNRRPILYAGFSSSGGGHAFVCDGYDSNDRFHFNWGWGGSANGFFSISALTPSNYNFSYNQQVVIGIKPKDGSGPAKNYALYMNTDLDAIYTSSGTSLSDVNPYNFGKTITLKAKVENNGTGTFNGYLKVGAFDANGDFVAWSNESYHFSLGSGKVTEMKTYTFNGGIPFVPGRYRAYMYYQDDDESDCKLVKTDEGAILTEYNNVVFTVVSSGDLAPISEFVPDDIYGSFITGSKLRINVDIRNGALLTTFYGKIRLCFYSLDGSLAEIIEEKDFSNGFSPATTKSLSFFNYVTVEPGSYYMALTYKESESSTWYYMRSVSAYPNPIKVVVTAPVLSADEYEVNNTQSTASTLLWEIDEEMEDFGTGRVSLHQESDIDYYKMVFPNSNKYIISVNLYDKYNSGSMWYVNAEAQYAYSLGGNTYSDYYTGNKVITFNGPNTLYIRVRPYGMTGMGFYELAGEIADVKERNDCKSVPYTESFASSKGDFTVYNAILPDGFTSIWNWDSQYGMVAKCIKGSTKYESESYLISPCIEIPMEGQTVLSFRHAAKFFQNTSQMTLWISTDFDASNPAAATWSQWPIPNYPPGTNWTWYDSGLIDVSGYKGQYINVAFRYTSNTSYAPQWEIKDFSVQNTMTPIDNISADQQPATKLLHNGQIFILRGEKIYTIQGQELR